MEKVEETKRIEGQGLRIADCGLRIEEDLQLRSLHFAIADCRLRFKKSAIRNPQSAIRNPHPRLSYFRWMVYMNVRVFAVIGRKSSIPSLNF